MVFQLLSEAEVLSLDTYKCPLCLKRRVNDTVLSVSGYVFCFNCIDTHVKRYNACPVTGLASNNQQLIRLYIQ
ncbi:hypothetical protein WR25_23239 isoform D [Diploscapter pachys]|uniref:Peroxisome assembly protein 12 n=1 Tax=Diploscapter pachys TaxID=2018661 RepID=A0A2A2JHY6_9BILA|nr:hypothetical protein WR25_23239 isoform B [Diploscapter pachys]PAV61222.1 hypothetical protein WR25_23239 isoform C [Diploscapter pachys]PAV61223.1 hypothetical protein WR25_23239 isoform D [Diploscapter pachys]